LCVWWRGGHEQRSVIPELFSIINREPGVITFACELALITSQPKFGINIFVEL
jgi:hypothetical protein